MAKKEPARNASHSDAGGEPKKPGEGKISFEDVPFVGGLLKGLEKFIDLAERVEQAGGEIRKSGTIKGLGGNKDVRGVYGFTIRTGLGQKTKVEPFGNIKKTKAGPKVAKTREPIVDLFDEKDRVLIIVELPGVDEKSIKLDFSAKGGSSPKADAPREHAFGGKAGLLLLEASGGNQKYYKEILLKSKIDFDSREMSFKNGVLELKFKKAK